MSARAGTDRRSTPASTAFGRQHACALRSADTLWCWGSSANGSRAAATPPPRRPPPRSVP
ncbi:RCC1-like domain-containing protein [Pilimelia terevasa]|uniref:RCC1-like domain-containing protein n=1 Tax=Pilimelia terevasa TaxID=53372 RepID=UPI00166D6F75